MGRCIENAVMEDIETAAQERGYKVLKGIYIPTVKNKPVEDLYPSLGYRTEWQEEDGKTQFSFSLSDPIERVYRLCRKSEVTEICDKRS